MKELCDKLALRGHLKSIDNNMLCLCSCLKKDEMTYFF